VKRQSMMGWGMIGRTRKAASFALALLGSMALAMASAAAVTASVSYTYDLLGRVATALYDNGACIVYSYDPNGNRTSQTITVSGSPTTPTWGTGSWGCFQWTPH
jgi:YD repeat-containing protein